MFLCHGGRRMFVCPGDGHSEKRAPHNHSCHRHQQDYAPHKRNLLLLLLRPHSGAFVYKGSTQLDAWSDYSPECVEEEFSEVDMQDAAYLRPDTPGNTPPGDTHSPAQ